MAGVFYFIAVSHQHHRIKKALLAPAKEIQQSLQVFTRTTLFSATLLNYLPFHATDNSSY